MHKQLTDLLPLQRQRRRLQEYYFRLAVVVIGAGIVLIAIAGILLLPTYVYLVGSAKDKADSLAHIKSSLSSEDDKNLSARLEALSNDASALIALSKKPSVSGALRSVLLVPRPGITVSSFTYTPGKSSTTILISGTSATRDALRNYQLGLQNQASIISATLPVSVYAKDSDISFTITLTLKP